MGLLGREVRYIGYRVRRLRLFLDRDAAIL
jgi:hypothetical protein